MYHESSKNGVRDVKPDRRKNATRNESAPRAQGYNKKFTVKS